MASRGGGLGERVAEATASFFEAVGVRVGSRPWLTIGLAFLVVLAGASGISQMDMEGRQENLWVPKETQAQWDKVIPRVAIGRPARAPARPCEQRAPSATDAAAKKHQKNTKTWIEAQGFPKSPRIEYLILESPGGSVLTPAAFDAALDLHEKMEKISVSVGGKAYTLADLCQKRGDACFTNNVLDIFGRDKASWDTEEKILEKLSAPGGSVVSAITSSPIDLEQVLGGIQRTDGKITSAKATAMSYMLANNEVMDEKEGGWVDPPAEEWEEQYLKIAAEADYAGLKVHRFASRTFGDEFGGAIQGDLQMLYGAIMFIIVYTVVMMSRWSRPCCNGLRLHLTLAGIFCIGGSFAMAMGICSYGGLFYSPLMSVAPFLLLGIGVDDMFVIVTQFDLQDPALPVKTRLGKALAEAGASITVTSLTDFFAFLIGSNTSLPALKVFSYYVAAAVMFNYILQITAFAATLAIDAKRMEEDRLDILWCVKRTKAETGCGRGCCGCACGIDDRKSNRAFASFAEKLMNKKVAVPVVLAFAGVLAGGIAGLTQIEVKADEKVRELRPDWLSLCPPGSCCELLGPDNTPPLPPHLFRTSSRAGATRWTSSTRTTPTSPPSETPAASTSPAGSRTRTRPTSAISQASARSSRRTRTLPRTPSRAGTTPSGSRLRGAPTSTPS